MLLKYYKWRLKKLEDKYKIVALKYDRVQDMYDGSYFMINPQDTNLLDKKLRRLKRKYKSINNKIKLLEIKIQFKEMGV